MHDNEIPITGLERVYAGKNITMRLSFFAAA